MADKKISALTGASTPLAGTEVLPIVQSGATVKVAVSNLTAGRAVATGALTVTGDQTLSTGNIIQGTAAKGFNFTANTPLAGMTSQLLNWYEEGYSTAVLTCDSGSITMNTARDTLAYVRIGRQVTVTGMVEVSSVSSPTGNFYISLPFTVSSLSEFSSWTAGTVRFGTVSANIADIVCFVTSGATTLRVSMGDGTSFLNTSAQQLQAGSQVIVNLTYFA
jgi:hypothetical protein